METGILERIKLIMNEHSLSERQFAMKIGISQQTLNNIFQRGSDDVKLSILQKILTTFGDVNISWLVLGEGNMIRVKNNQLSSEDLDLMRETIKNLNYTINEQKTKIELLEKSLKNRVMVCD